jgi:hypothetical protein
MSNEYTIESDGKIARLEKRGRGFRRLITAINDLPLYGIIEATDPNLIKQLEVLKDRVKDLISENNNDIISYYVPSEPDNSDPLKDKINNLYSDKGI